MGSFFKKEEAVAHFFHIVEKKKKTYVDMSMKSPGLILGSKDTLLCGIKHLFKRGSFPN